MSCKMVPMPSFANGWGVAVVGYAFALRDLGAQFRKLRVGLSTCGQLVSRQSRVFSIHCQDIVKCFAIPTNLGLSDNNLVVGNIAQRNIVLIRKNCDDAVTQPHHYLPTFRHHGPRYALNFSIILDFLPVVAVGISVNNKPVTLLLIVNDQSRNLWFPMRSEIGHETPAAVKRLTGLWPVFVDVASGIDFAVLTPRLKWLTKFWDRQVFAAKCAAITRAVWKNLRLFIQLKIPQSKYVWGI